MHERTIDPVVIPHHFADSGWNQQKELVVDQPLTAEHLAALATEAGYVHVSINLDYAQVLAWNIGADVSLPHYVPLMFDPELAPLVLAAVANEQHILDIHEIDGGSVPDSHNGKPLLNISGDFSAVLTAAGYRFIGWGKA